MNFWNSLCFLHVKQQGKIQKPHISIFFDSDTNWYFLAKIEWEKCPTSDILQQLSKLFQIRQVWKSSCDNKPYPNFASKVVSYDVYHRYKLCIGDKHHKRQLLSQNLGIVYYCTNSSKLVWFGMIWLVFAKYHLWGIFPTQFLPKNTNFVSELENNGKYEFLKFTTLLNC